MNKPSKIFLVGPAGAGKSTIGLEIARRLNMQFFDTDKEVTEKTGVTLSWIYDIEGEVGFRRRETSVLQRLVEIPNTILATGGDIVIEKVNRDLLSGRGLIVYLCTTLDQQLVRTRNKDHRPKLLVDNVEAALKDLRAELIPLYEDIADITFDTRGKSVKHVAKAVCDYLLRE